MKIAPYWFKVRYEHIAENGKKYWFFANGWSFESLNAAQEDALARAKRNMQIFFAGKQKAGGRYYPDRPIREEIIDEIRIDEKQAALITRNGYGAIVLNSASIMFVDIDFAQKESRGGILARLFGRRKKVISPERDELSRVKDWAVQNPQYSFRLYETAAGLRLLFTDRLFDPASDEVSAIMQSLGADPLYLRLCQTQECFRARLTPKPWRIGFYTPPHRYPFFKPKFQEQNRKWEKLYGKKIAGFQTARLLEEFGQGAAVKEARAIVAYHDELCGVGGNKALA